MLFNPFKPGIIFCGTWANSAEPDQTPQNMGYDQVFHCLLTGVSIKNEMEMKNIPVTPKIECEQF